MSGYFPHLKVEGFTAPFNKPWSNAPKVPFFHSGRRSGRFLASARSLGQKSIAPVCTDLLQIPNGILINAVFVVGTPNNKDTREAGISAGDVCMSTYVWWCVSPHHPSQSRTRYKRAQD
jgi:hypothetical protein